MKLVELLVVAVVVAAVLAQDVTTTHLASELNSSTLHDNVSLLSSLLKTTGYSDTCVSAALDLCALQSEDDSRNTSLVENARGLVQQLSQTLHEWKSQPRHCKDLLDAGDSESGVRHVYPYREAPHHHVTVYCNHSIDGGGWTVFQRRSIDFVREDFSRSWVEYQLGFGNLEGEFWLGLDLLHLLTSSSLQQLRVDLDDDEGGRTWAKYGYFNVGSPETKYRLSVGRYTGDAGDSLAITKHQGKPFTTHDADNDGWGGNCAQYYKGGWWYGQCSHSNLNGYQHVSNIAYEDGIVWIKWRGAHYSLRQTSMMIRPAF